MGWVLIFFAAANGFCLAWSDDTAYAIASAIFYVGAALCWTGENIKRAIDWAGRGSK